MMKTTTKTTTTTTTPMMTQAPPRGLASNPGGAAIAIGYGALTLVATAAVLLRFRARRLTAVRPGADDLLAAATLALNYGLLVVTALALVYGDLGAAARGDAAVTALFKCLLAFNFLYGAAAALAKLAVLALYRRVFPTAFMRRACAALGAASLLHGVAFVVVTAVQCVPLAAFWQRWLHHDDGGAGAGQQEQQQQQQGRCVDVLLFYAVMSVPDAVIDALVLCLPVREVLRLQASRAKKAGICGVFGVVIASATRVNAMLRWYNQGIDSTTQNMTGPWAAAAVEITTAIVGGCLPVLPPIWFCLRRKTRRHSSNGDDNKPAPLSSSARSRKSNMSAAMLSIVTIGRISSHNNNHNNRRRLTLTETGFELEGTRFDRIESLVDIEADAMVMQTGGQRDEGGESHTRSQGVCVDAVHPHVSTDGSKADWEPRRVQKREKEDAIESAGTAS